MQFWRVKELSVPGIVASTINLPGRRNLRIFDRVSGFFQIYVRHKGRDGVQNPETHPKSGDLTCEPRHAKGSLA